MNRNLDSLIDRDHQNGSAENESTSDLPASVQSARENDEYEAKEENDGTDASGVEDQDDDDSAAEELMELLQMTKKSNELASKKQLF